MSPLIDRPGIFEDVPEDVYHGDRSLAPELGRSLSASGAKVLLKCPARFNWERDNPPPPRDVFDLGTAAHTLILGTGQPFVCVDDVQATQVGHHPLHGEVIAPPHDLYW